MVSNRCNLAENTPYGALQLEPGAHTATVLSPHFNDVLASVVRDCVEGQILQGFPLISSLSSRVADVASGT